MTDKDVSTSIVLAILAARNRGRELGNK